ncbi:MAG: hypothetical protein AB7S26_01890 [Sandaracinaceae bacterium]
MTRIRSALVLGALLWVASPAAAQTRVSGTDFRTRQVVDDTLLQAGRFSLFLSATGGWAYGSTSPDNGAGHSQNTIFSLPSIGAGLMLTDALQLRLAVNGIIIHSGIDGSQSQETYGVGATVQGLYHFPIVHGMAFYGGIGLGGFYSTRTEPIPGALEVRLSGGGFQGQVPIGLLVQPGSSLFLRGGLRLDVLVGVESPASTAVGVSGGTFVNVLTNAELSVGFRF